MKEDNPIDKYSAIIHLPHHQATGRKHMSLYDRAAQFAPFAALTGYDDMVKETARLTDRKVDLSEYEIDILNQRLAEISYALQQGEHPAVTVTFFVPDSLKEGGSYETMTAKVRRVDPIEQKIMLFGSDDTDDKRIPPIVIPIEDVLSIEKDE